MRQRRKAIAGAAVALVIVGAAVVPLGLLTRLGQDGRPAADSGASVTGILPDVARVVCDDDGTHVLTSEVRPKRDGVHFQINNRTEERMSIRTGHTGGGFGTGAEPGLSELKGPGPSGGWPVPPGSVTVRCFRLLEDHGDKSGQVPFEVIDEEGIYVPAELDCRGGDAVTGSGLIVEGARGETGDPVELTRAHFDGRQNGDVVERAGYPDQSGAVVRVARDGRTIATAEWIDDGHGGWLLSTSSRCQDSGLIG
ncbi:MAG: hypothetical protein ACRDHO_13020 [Actinomycetota bacterium]